MRNKENEVNLVERKGIWYEVNSEVPFSGVAESYHFNGQLEIKGSYKDGKKDGLWETYYANGKLLETSNFEDGIDVKHLVLKKLYEGGIDGFYLSLKKLFSEFRNPKALVNKYYKGVDTLILIVGFLILISAPIIFFLQSSNDEIANAPIDKSYDKGTYQPSTIGVYMVLNRATELAADDWQALCEDTFKWTKDFRESIFGDLDRPWDYGTNGDLELSAIVRHGYNPQFQFSVYKLTDTVLCQYTTRVIGSYQGLDYNKKVWGYVNTIIVNDKGIFAHHPDELGNSFARTAK